MLLAHAFLLVLSVYAACGFLFALAFVAFGVDRIDESANHASLGFRLLILPGCIAFWPLLLSRWRAQGAKS